MPIIFKPDLIEKILYGEKNETRRLVKEGDYWDGKAQAVKTKNGRIRWQVGKPLTVVGGRGKPAVWYCPKCSKHFNGDLYFIAEKHKDGYALAYARLYSMPEFAEWGEINIPYLQKEYGTYKFWQVKKANWSNINSYEPNLFNHVEVSK